MSIFRWDLCFDKKSLSDFGVKFISSKSSEFVWWKSEKSFFNFEEDIYICSVFPPVNSKHFGKK